MHKALVRPVLAVSASVSSCELFSVGSESLVLPVPPMTSSAGFSQL